MLSDSHVIVRRFKSAIKIACISDVHYGALEHMGREWASFVQSVLADPAMFLILNGDLINNNTRSSVGSPWDDKVRPSQQKKDMVEALAPIRDRILCCTSGNHERRSSFAMMILLMTSWQNWILKTYTVPMLPS